METADGMETSQPDEDKADASKPPEAQEEMSSLETLGAVIVAPARGFGRIAARPKWLTPVIILLLWLVVSFLRIMLPGFIIIMNSLGSGRGRGPLSAFSPPLLVAIGLFQFVFFVCLLAVVFLLMTAALYLILKAFKQKAPFLALASGLAFAEFVPRLARVSLQEALPLLAGGGRFARELPTGIVRLFPNVDFPTFLGPLLGRIELFHLWSFALVVILLEFVAGVSRNKGIAIAAAYWLVCILAVTGFAIGVDLLKAAMMGSLG